MLAQPQKLQVEGVQDVTYALNVDELNVKSPQDGWGAHDLYYPFPPLPPPAAVERRTHSRRTSVGRRDRSGRRSAGVRERSSGRRERSRSRGRSGRLVGAGRRSPARREGRNRSWGRSRDRWADSPPRRWQRQSPPAARRRRSPTPSKRRRSRTEER